MFKEHSVINKYILLGMNAIANPQIISRVPTVRRYHLDGTLKSSASANGNTFAYLTYSFL